MGWSRGQATFGVELDKSTSIDLGEGVRIYFAGSNMKGGDHWTFATRQLYAAPQVNLLNLSPPMGTQHHYVKLASISNSSQSSTGFRLLDLREQMPQLTHLNSSDIIFEPGKSSLTRRTLAQIIDSMATSIVDLQKRVRDIEQKQGAGLTVNPPFFVFTNETTTISDLLTIIGTGFTPGPNPVLITLESPTGHFTSFLKSANFAHS